MAELEDMGLVKRNPRASVLKGKLSNEYDLSGLVARLKELAIEFRAADEEAKKKATGRHSARPPEARVSGGRRGLAVQGIAA